MGGLNTRVVLSVRSDDFRQRLVMLIVNGCGEGSGYKK